MVVKLRLQRFGYHKRPYYRIVAADSQSKRDGRFIEIVGHYDPLKPVEEAVLNQERIRYWIDVGAKPTARTAVIIKKHMEGVLEEKIRLQRQNIQRKRRARKERQKARANS